MDSRAAARAQQLNLIVRSLDLPPLYLADAVTLERNSRDFEDRCRLASSNGRALAEWLSVHPCVGSLYYSSGREYESVMRTNPGAHTAEAGADAGYGSLMSIILTEGTDEKAFFDALELSKGPSLGTNFTLACPYTLLAHYTELDWASKYGVDRRLIRVSVGLEDIEVGAVPYHAIPCHLMPHHVIFVISFRVMSIHTIFCPTIHASHFLTLGAEGSVQQGSEKRSLLLLLLLFCIDAC